MAQLYTNNAYGVLASSIGPSDTTVTLMSGDGARFPSPGAGDFFLLTLIALDGNASEASWEIVRVTARSGDTLTVVRAQEGTTGLIWPAASRAELRATAGTFSQFAASSDVQASLNLKANLASPALTGTPTAPTASVGTNTTQIATTAYVREEVAALVASAPGTLDTLNELATALGNDPNFATTVTNSLAGKAPLTGAGTSGTWGISITGNAATATRLINLRTINGVGFDGTADITIADSTKLPLSGGTLTGELYVPNLTVGGQGRSALNAIGGNIGATAGSWNNAQLELKSTDAGTVALAFHRAGYTSNTIEARDGNGLRIDGNFILHAGNYNSYALPLSGGTLTGALYFTDTTNGIYKSGGRLTVRSESTDDVANFASYGLYLPQTGQTAGLYVESPIEARGGLRIGNGAGSGTITVGADTSETASRLVQRDSSGGIFGTYIRARKNQTAGNYTTAALWTESYGNTATGVAFHISGNVGKFLEMRTDGILYWNGDTVVHSGNYSSWALPVSGGTLTGALTVGTTGSASQTRALRVVPTGTNPGSFGSYSGSWRSTIEIWDNAATRMLHLTPPDGTNYNYSSIKSTDAGLKIDVGGSGGTNAVTFEANGVANFPQGLQQGGNQVLHAGNYNSYAPTLGGTGASGTWGINITGNAAGLSGGATINNANFNGIMQFPSGGGGATFASNHYSMGKDIANGNWSHPHYSDLIIGYHTGIRIGASYSGIRFYNNSPTTDANNDGNGDQGEALLMTIGGHAGGTGVIVNNTLNVGGVIYSPSYGASSGNTTTRYTNPRGGASSWNGSVTGAIKIRLPFRANDNMWRMKVYIYNYGENTMWEYHIGNYAYSAGGYNSAASCICTGNATPLTVRWGNDGSYDCVWIGETSTGWSYPFVSVTDFGAGYANAASAQHQDSWDISYVASFGTVATSYTPLANLASGSRVAGNAILHAGNYNSYSPTLTGSGASGTWGISVTGSASSLNFGGGYTAQMGDWGLRNTTPYGWIQFGPANSSWCHIYGSQAFYFNQDLYTNGALQLHSSNYNSYAPTLTGGGASGTWGINITGNAGSISGQANSATITASTGVNGNHIVQRDGNGYIYANHINFNTSESENPSINSFFTSNGDGWSRKSSLAHVKNQIRGVADGTWSINITGNADSAYGLAVHGGRNNEANKVVRTDGNGYLQTGYINSSNGDENNASSPARVWGTNGSDSYLRTYQTGSLSVGTATNGRYVYDNGAYSGSAAYREASSMHVYYAYLGRLAYNNGAYSGSGWVEPSDLGVRYAARSQRANGNFYIDDNYGNGIVGVYASTRYQGVFAMGDSYKLPADGTSTGSLYGIAWSHPNTGGVAGNLDSHGLLVLINGGFGSAMSYSIVASGNVTAYSDERLKTNWRPMPENFVERLAQVKVGIYDRIDGEQITQVGIGAQSFQRLLPEAITKAKDEMGTLSVSYGNAAMASAVELAKEIVAIKRELEALKARLH